MATSSKVMFDLETLKNKALESLDFKIAQQELEVSSFDDDDALAQRISEWREAQKQKVIDLASKIDEIDDHRLAKFKIDPIPEVDRWERSRAEGDLRRLRARRADILAKSGSLVPDAEGKISLTKTQLSEFFGL